MGKDPKERIIKALVCYFFILNFVYALSIYISYPDEVVISVPTELNVTITSTNPLEDVFVSVTSTCGIEAKLIYSNITAISSGEKVIINELNSAAKLRFLVRNLHSGLCNITVFTYTLSGEKASSFKSIHVYGEMGEYESGVIADESIFPIVLSFVLLLLLYK